MTHEQQALWRRIRDFQIDAPNASYPYSARLAREQGWTPAYAERVIEEYRRFAFLAVASGHGATPSKAVDEAWHLHLIYTRNYWEEFCPHALGRPLHHNPGDGGGEDDAKYEGWYQDTLASYERLFGEAAPADVWPRPGVPDKRRRSWPWLALLPLTLVGCSEPANPLDWHGPAFLALFAGLYAAAFGVALLLRYALRKPIDGPPAQEWRLHVYEKAHLNEGGKLALATALTRLRAEGKIVVDGKKRVIRAAPEADGDCLLDRAILKAASGETGASYESVHRVVAPILGEIEGSLRRQGLWVTPEIAARAALIPAFVAMLPIFLGIAKVAVGVSRDRPVGFLVFGCIAAMALNVVFLLPTKRSRYGDAALADLRRQKRNARHAGGRAGFPPDLLATGVALYGVSILTDASYDDLRNVVVPLSSSAGGSSCGSGSSCSSGSSCGGGGSSCGGGGCGGCGGS